MRDDTVQGAAEADDKEILVEALAVAHKNVGGKFKALAQFSNLLQRELPLPREEHGIVVFLVRQERAFFVVTS